MKSKSALAYFFGIILIFNTCKDFIISEDSRSLQILTQDASTLRFSQVQNVHYDLLINLMDRSNFIGIAEIQFDLIRMDSPLRIDFGSGKILTAKINGKPVSDIKYKSGFFNISINSLEPGRNVITIEYTHPYSRSGNGLHIFEDPLDREIYIYSQFETNHAKSMFPCFDQPDIKATYTLKVIHPKHWIAISSTTPVVTENSAESLLSSFPETAKISTYVFSLHAGPYYEWKDSYKNISLRLFARKSMKDFVDSKFWFQITKQGLQYFETYFEIPYPFGKYDQIIVPEFNFGAMENVGAVTFSERFLSRGQVTRSMKEKLASVILHEMAHMWFGNLVTMKWWDGLWLNESFATYLSTKAQYEATEFKEAWETFFTGMKSWAYREDKSVTTHPIQGIVSDTEQAFTNFDGITYGKGASVLKQLEFYTGEDTFRKGVSLYLKKYSYSNATLEDFLSSIEEVSGKDLKSWSEEWLKTEGFNRILSGFTCTEDGKFLKEISIDQDHITNTKVLRTHRTEVAVFQISRGKLKYLDSQKIEYSSEKNRFPWKNTSTKCPDFIYPNYNDYDYVKVDYPQEILDEKGLSKLRAILQTERTLETLMFWRDMNEEIREGDLSLQRFSELAMDLLENEARDIVLDSNLGLIVSSKFPSYNSLLYLKPEKERYKFIVQLENWTWNNMLKSRPYSDRKRSWFKSYLSVGYTDHFKKRALNLLQSSESTHGIKIDQDLRWAILLKLCSLESRKDALQNLLEEELKRDSTKFGKDSALSCESSIADPVLKGIWMNQLLSPNEEYSSSTLRGVMYHIFPIHQMGLQIPFVEFYFQNIQNSKIGGDENYLESYTSLLAPRFCTEENWSILKRFIHRISNSELPPIVLKSLRMTLESEEECLKIRKKSEI